MAQYNSSRERPLAITLICILGFISSALLSLGLLMAGSEISLLKAIWLCVVNIAGWTFLLGMWRMKKSGAIGYIVFSVLRILVAIVVSQFSWVDLLFSVVTIGLIMPQLDKME